MSSFNSTHSAANDRVFWGLLAMSMLAGIALTLLSGNGLRYVDESDYLELGKQLGQGLGYTKETLAPTAYRPPGYPFLLAFFSVLPFSVVAAKLANVALLGLSSYLMKRIAEPHAPTWAWLCGAAPLAYPVWLYTASTLYPQILCMALLLGIIYLITADKKRTSTHVFAGFMLGYLILVAPSFLLLTPLFFLIAVWHSSFGMRKWGNGLLLAAATAITLAPWTIRNYVVFHDFVPVATNGGVNLLLGNNPGARANSGVDVDIQRYLASAKGRSEPETSRILQSHAIAWVKEHPTDALSLYFRKLLNYFNYRAEPATKANQAAWKDWLMFLTYYPIIALAILRVGLLRRFPLTKTEGTLLILYLVNGALAAVFFTRIRFRLPFDALLFCFVIMSLPAILATLQGRLSRPLGRPSKLKA